MAKKRVLTQHLVPADAEGLTIAVLDEPGPGGAHHAYEISGFDVTANAFWCDDEYGLLDKGDPIPILFQHGGIPAFGRNGITQEALLAIVEDRLACFQAGPFACEANEKALSHVRQALACLHARTRDRMARGVEGQNKA